MKLKKIVGLIVLFAFSSAVFAETFTLNFKDADIKDLIKFVGDSTGYTIIVDPKITAKVCVDGFYIKL